MKIPTQGSRVKVSVSYPMGRSMIPPQPTEQIFEGTVLAPHRWLTDSEFCLSGSDAWPVRVINARNCISIDVIEGNFRQVDDKPKSWTVTGSKGAKYTISRNHSGLSCTCPGFQFRKSCKHTAAKEAA